MAQCALLAKAIVFMEDTVDSGARSAVATVMATRVWVCGGVGKGVPLIKIFTSRLSPVAS